MQESGERKREVVTFVRCVSNLALQHRHIRRRHCVAVMRDNRWGKPHDATIPR
jgi:hypothetical protein